MVQVAQAPGELPPSTAHQPRRFYQPGIDDRRMMTRNAFVFKQVSIAGEFVSCCRAEVSYPG
jgi:hypothetical protein